MGACGVLWFLCEGEDSSTCPVHGEMGGRVPLLSVRRARMSRILLFILGELPCSEMG